MNESINSALVLQASSSQQSKPVRRLGTLWTLWTLWTFWTQRQPLWTQRQLHERQSRSRSRSSTSHLRSSRFSGPSRLANPLQLNSPMHHPTTMVTLIKVKPFDEPNRPSRVIIPHPIGSLVLCELSQANMVHRQRRIQRTKARVQRAFLVAELARWLSLHARRHCKRGVGRTPVVMFSDTAGCSGCWQRFGRILFGSFSDTAGARLWFLFLECDCDVGLEPW
jgi:hypothetical protein